MSTKRPRDDIEGFVHGSCFRNFYWATIAIVSLGPINIDVIIGRYEFTICPVENKKEAVFGSLHDYFATLPINHELAENHVLR